MKKLILSMLLCATLAGCALGPDYGRPGTNTPDGYRGAGTLADAATTATLGDQKWWEVYPDERLQALIRTALEHNYDVRIAAARILQAEAQQDLVIADRLPRIDAGASAARSRSAQAGIVPPAQSSQYRTSLAFNWDLSFWWTFRRANEAAQANLLASERGRDAVKGTLVSNVAAAYFRLRELDLELEISKQALVSRQGSLELTKTLADHGATSLLDVRQAEQLVYTASEQIPDLERRIQQQENLISILLGTNPGPVERGRRLTDEPHAPEVPVGLPSALLERRPDIQQSEQELVLLNANIGLAKAQYFPQINLTGVGGYQSNELGNLFTKPAQFWNVGAAATQTIFDSGRIHFGVKLAEAQHEQALLTYQQTVQQAFREVSDALIAYRKDQEFRAQQQLLTRAAEGASELSNTRYRGGAASYLEVLTNETNTFSAELGLARAQLSELLDLVELYRALGGGWQGEATAQNQTAPSPTESKADQTP